MPITKIVKDSQVYFEIKAKYESKVGTVAELAKEYGVSRQYLTEYAKKEKWERGAIKDIYEAEKLVAQNKVLNEFKKKEEKNAMQKVSKKAQKEGEKRAVLMLQDENYKLEMKNKVAKIAQEYLEVFSQGINKIKNGSLVDKEFEYVGKTAEGRTANVKQKTTALRPKDFDPIIKLLQSIDILSIPQTPTVAIQNNNQQTNIEAKVVDDITDDQLKEAVQILQEDDKK